MSDLGEEPSTSTGPLSAEPVSAGLDPKLIEGLPPILQAAARAAFAEGKLNPAQIHMFAEDYASNKAIQVLRHTIGKDTVQASHYLASIRDIINAYARSGSLIVETPSRAPKRSLDLDKNQQDFDTAIALYKDLLGHMQSLTKAIFGEEFKDLDAYTRIVKLAQEHRELLKKLGLDGEDVRAIRGGAKILTDSRKIFAKVEGSYRNHKNMHDFAKSIDISKTTQFRDAIVRVNEKIRTGLERKQGTVKFPYAELIPYTIEPPRQSKLAHTYVFKLPASFRKWIPDLTASFRIDANSIRDAATLLERTVRPPGQGDISPDQIEIVEPKTSDGLTQMIRDPKRRVTPKIEGAKGKNEIQELFSRDEFDTMVADMLNESPRMTEIQRAGFLEAAERIWKGEELGILDFTGKHIYSQLKIRKAQAGEKVLSEEKTEESTPLTDAELDALKWLKESGDIPAGKPPREGQVIESGDTGRAETTALSDEEIEALEWLNRLKSNST